MDRQGQYYLKVNPKVNSAACSLISLVDVQDLGMESVVELKIIGDSEVVEALNSPGVNHVNNRTTTLKQVKLSAT